jgi:cytosine/adenosine deaminase-related metal-dependent hydrolase
MREFADAHGTPWRVEMISHGGTSGYLHPKVHRPVLQFSCLAARRPRRYLGYAPETQGDLATLSEAALQELLQQAKMH